MAEVKSLPNPFLAAFVDLQQLKINHKKIESNKTFYNSSLKSISVDLASRLTNLIPKTESGLVLMLGSSVSSMDGKSFLEALLSKLINEEKHLLSKEASLQFFPSFLPFIMGFTEITTSFEAINLYWKNIAQIGVTKQDPYYFFTITFF